MWHRTTETVKRQPIMTYAAQMSKTFMNIIKMQSNLSYRILNLTNFVIDLKLPFQGYIKCRKLDVSSEMPNVIDIIE